jgi:hypothetical protein
MRLSPPLSLRMRADGENKTQISTISRSLILIGLIGITGVIGVDTVIFDVSIGTLALFVGTSLIPSSESFTTNVLYSLPPSPSAPSVASTRTLLLPALPPPSLQPSHPAHSPVALPHAPSPLVPTSTQDHVRSKRSEMHMTPCNREDENVRSSKMYLAPRRWEDDNLKSDINEPGGYQRP